MASNEDVPSPSNKSKIFKCDKHAVSVLKTVQDLYEEQELFDIALITGAERVKVQAHRLVLLITSKYFRSMFRANLQEATTTVIELKEIDGDTLKLIVEFSYTGSIELRTETVEGILKAADYLELPTLIVACWEFIGKQLDVSNCIGISRFAQRYSLTELYKESSDFAYKNLEKVCQEEEFLEMDSTQLNELLASDDASVPSEEVVFRSLMVWVNHDRANRWELMYNLLSIVRFSFLTPQFISEHVVPIFETDECLKLILKWLHWHLVPGSRTEFPNPHNNPRKTNTKAFILSGTTTFPWRIQTYDRDLNVWSCQDLPMSWKIRTEFGAIMRNGKLIFTGGRCDDKNLNTVDCLDLVTLKWTALPPMQKARYNHAMAEVGGNLYVIGGASKNDFGFPMEMYDFSTEKWKDLAPVPLKDASKIRSVVLNGLLYVCNNENLLCYDLVKNEWSSRPREVCNRDNGFVAVGEYLYSVGGSHPHGYISWCKSDHCKRFSPLTGESKPVSSLKFKIDFPTCFALNSRLIVCGGEQNDGEDDPGEQNDGRGVEEYDPETDEWSVLAPILHKDDLYVRNSL